MSVLIPAAINQLNLLQRLYTRLIIPTAVYNEMDERRGRAVAMSYGLQVTGLLGILLQAKRNRLIPAVKPLMEQLIEQADFRVSNQLYATILEFAGERLLS